MTNVQKTVCWILGTAYSGSSLLNLLLDGQPGVRGMGEAFHFISGKERPWCTVCQTSVLECSLKKYVDEDEFYQSIFRFYTDCNILVDSSKWWKFCAIDHGIEPGICYKAVFISKTPHEFAYSLIHHNAQADARHAFLEWIQCYRSHLRVANKALQLAEGDVVSIPYQEMSDSPIDTVQNLCEFLNVPFDLRRAEEWWKTDSHIIGGNNAVHAQVTGEEWFDESKDYLQGKYSGKFRKIFRDDHWRKDIAFRSECSRLYNELAGELDPILIELGHPNSEALLKEVESSIPISE